MVNTRVATCAISPRWGASVLELARGTFGAGAVLAVAALAVDLARRSATMEMDARAAAGIGTIFIYAAEPGSRSEEALKLLGYRRPPPSRRRVIEQT
jgi:hypothetical protein